MLGFRWITTLHPKVYRFADTSHSDPAAYFHRRDTSHPNSVFDFEPSKYIHTYLSPTMHGTMRAVCAAAVAALVAFGTSPSFPSLSPPSWGLVRGQTKPGTSVSPVPSTQAADSVVRQDSVTGFTFSEFRAQYVLGGYITYGVAVPSGVAAGTPYDVVLQVTAPVDVGWAGLAWGGSMTSNPLAVSWQNGNSAVVSSRFATYVVFASSSFLFSSP